MKLQKFNFSVKSMVQRIFDNTLLKLILNRPIILKIFYANWKLLHGNIFNGDINGANIQFYDPYIRSEPYGIHLLTGRLYEHSVIMHLKNVRKDFESPIFLDVGAHYGYYTVFMSKLGGPSGKVLSFEPNTEYFKILSTNVNINKLQNVILYRVALSDQKGRATFETSRRIRTIRTLGVSINHPDKSVSTITFDELAQTTKVSPDIVKIDVHGAEGNVITGMKRTLKKNISHLYCELHDNMIEGYTARNIVDTLQDAGLETFEFRGFRTQKGKFIEIHPDLFSSPSKRMIYAKK